MIARVHTALAAATLTIALSVSLSASPAYAETCQKFGGWGTGALESFASFMAEAAMKNAAKAKFGDSVKIGPVTKKCEVPTLLVECRAFARACK